MQEIYRLVDHIRQLQGRRRLSSLREKWGSTGLGDNETGIPFKYDDVMPMVTLPEKVGLSSRLARYR